MIDVPTLRKKRDLFDEMRLAVERGTWNEETFRALRQKALDTLPPGEPVDFLYVHAADEWLEPGEFEADSGYEIGPSGRV